MAKTKQTAQDKKIVELKKQYIEYYKELPVQKYAAMYIAKDEDTILRWRTNDSDFADKVDRARASWVMNKASKAKVEFALERLEKSIFKESREIEITLPTPILNGIEAINVQTNDSSQETTELNEEN
jgi:hypothetical protein